MENKLYTIIVYTENVAGMLSQVSAVFTRRQINIESISASASSIKGVHKYTITACTDECSIIKVVRQIEKKIEVLQAHFFTDDEIFYHEIALFKIATPELESNPYISKVIRRHGGSIVEVNSVYSIVKKGGMSDEITSLYNELQETGCMFQFVRSGRIAITKSNVEHVNEFITEREQQYMKSHSQNT